MFFLLVLVNVSMNQNELVESDSLWAKIELSKQEMLLDSIRVGFNKSLDSLQISYSCPLRILDSLGAQLIQRIEIFASPNRNRDFTTSIDSIKRLRERTIEAFKYKLQSFKRDRKWHNKRPPLATRAQPESLFIDKRNRKLQYS